MFSWSSFSNSVLIMWKINCLYNQLAFRRKLFTSNLAFLFISSVRVRPQEVKKYHTEKHRNRHGSWNEEDGTATESRVYWWQHQQLQFWRKVSDVSVSGWPMAKENTKLPWVTLQPVVQPSTADYPDHGTDDLDLLKRWRNAE